MPLEHRDHPVLGDQRAQLADQSLAGRRSPGVDDSPRRVPALEPEREPAVTVGVERDAESRKVLDRRRRLGAQHSGGRLPDRPAPGRDRVGEVQLGAVTGRERGRETALRPVARRLGQRGRRIRA